MVAVLVLLFLLDFPDKSAKSSQLEFRTFLSPEEVTVILDRIERDRGDATPEKFSLGVIISNLKDWKLWDCFLLLLCNVCPFPKTKSRHCTATDSRAQNTVAYSFAYFLPLILHGQMGYSIEMTYVLIFPPYVLAAIVSQQRAFAKLAANYIAVDVHSRIHWRPLHDSRSNYSFQCNRDHHWCQHVCTIRHAYITLSFLMLTFS